MKVLIYWGIESQQVELKSSNHVLPDILMLLKHCKLQGPLRLDVKLTSLFSMQA